MSLYAIWLKVVENCSMVIMVEMILDADGDDVLCMFSAISVTAACCNV